MLSCSGDDLAVPHDVDPSGDDVLTIVGGHLNVHPTPIVFKVRGHVDIARSVPEVADLNFTHCGLFW